MKKIIIAILITVFVLGFQFGGAYNGDKDPHQLVGVNFGFEYSFLNLYKVRIFYWHGMGWDFSAREVGLSTTTGNLKNKDTSFKQN